jgi:cyclase
MIENLAFECRMPFCYGGGIKTVEQARRIFSLGVEKIAISSIAFENPAIVTDIAGRVGNQSVVIVMDIKKKIMNGTYEIWTHNGTKNTGKDPVELAAEMENLGAGEIVVNSIENDGIMKGYDLKLIQKIRDVINIPFTVMGGAGSLDDIGNVIKQYGIIGAAAGSLFVFKGKYRAVLISYPTREEKESLIERYFKFDTNSG